MPSKLEEVLDQIASLQQMRSAGALSESEYAGLKEDILQKALPGKRAPGPSIYDSRLPYDTQDEQDASGLKRVALVAAILAVVAAPLVAAGYFHLVSRVPVAREAGRENPAPQPKVAARIPAPTPVIAPAPELAPAREDTGTAPVPNTATKVLAQQPPGLRGAAKSLAAAGSLPIAVGQCAQTVVANVARRSYDDAGPSNSGSAIQYKNGGRQISEAQIGGIDASMPGDRVRLCLVSRADRCPDGTNRGAVYHALNLRTGENWDARDSVAGCDGP